MSDSPQGAKPARKSTRKPARKKAAAQANAGFPALEDPSIADLRPINRAYPEDSLIVVLNANPYPVTANSHGQALAGYSRGVVSSLDLVTRRAIEKGILLVPSDQ